MMRSVRNLKSNVTALFAATLGAMIFGLGVALYDNWQSHLEKTSNNLLRTVHGTAALFNSAVIDGSKIIDIAKINLNYSGSEWSMSEPRARHVLDETVRLFSLYNQADYYGLLLAYNQRGQMVARSGQVNPRPIEVSDRYYFTDLKAHPEKLITVGPMVKAKTTGEVVFHVATPITDRQGRFNGLVALQIKVDGLSELLYGALPDDFEQVQVLLSNGMRVFVHPSLETPNPEDISAVPLLNKIESAWQSEGLIREGGVLGGWFSERLIAYKLSPQFGMVTIASQPMSNVYKDFLNTSWPLLVLAAVSAILINYLFFRLYQDATRLEQSHKELREDSVTQLHNRRSLDEILPLLWREARRNQQPISVLFIDIDDFKKYNDTYGHEDGDRALIAVANTLQGFLLRPLDFGCRWGGEEFVLVLPDTDAEGAVHMANQILHAIRHLKIPCNGQHYGHLTVSVGIFTAVVTDENIDVCPIERADKAMFYAKQQGKDRYAVYAPEILENTETGNGGPG